MFPIFIQDFNPIMKLDMSFNTPACTYFKDNFLEGDYYAVSPLMFLFMLAYANMFMNVFTMHKHNLKPKHYRL